MIGWLAMWESEMPEQERRLAGMMSIPSCFRSGKTIKYIVYQYQS